MESNAPTQTTSTIAREEWHDSREPFSEKRVADRRLRGKNLTEFIMKETFAEG
jgi:hypothetical protein